MALRIDNDARSILVGLHIIPDYLAMRLVDHMNAPVVSSLSTNNNARIGGTLGVTGAVSCGGDFRVSSSGAKIGFWGKAVTSYQIGSILVLAGAGASTTNLKEKHNTLVTILTNYGLTAND